MRVATEASSRPSDASIYRNIDISIRFVLDVSFFEVSAEICDISISFGGFHFKAKIRLKNTGLITDYG